MSIADIAALIAALGLGTVLPRLIEGILGWLSGRQTWERDRVRSLTSELDHAEAERDAEASKRRRIAEHASDLRRLLISHGVPYDTIPPWPIPSTREDNPNA